MPETYKEYPILEIAISTRSRSPLASGSELIQEGDIVAIRRPYHTIGTLEGKDFLWLRIYGEDIYDMGIFVKGVEIIDAEGDPVAHYDNRRYSIPLERLKEIFPALDLDRARDLNDDYQPFIPIDEDNYRYIEGAARAEYPLYGLVLDKQTMKFL